MIIHKYDFLKNMYLKIMIWFLQQIRSFKASNAETKKEM